MQQPANNWSIFGSSQTELRHAARLVRPRCVPGWLFQSLSMVATYKLVWNRLPPIPGLTSQRHARYPTCQGADITVFYGDNPFENIGIEVGFLSNLVATQAAPNDLANTCLRATAYSQFQNAALTEQFDSPTWPRHGMWPVAAAERLTQERPSKS